MSGKRIYELTEKSNLENDYFMALDKSGTANAQKVNVSKILNPINNISGSSDEYSASKAYTKGDLVIHDNKLYVCNTSCSAAAWSTNQGYFTQSTLATEVTNVKSSLTLEDLSSIVHTNTTNFDVNILTLKKQGHICILSFALTAKVGFATDVSRQFIVYDNPAYLPTLIVSTAIILTSYPLYKGICRVMPSSGEIRILNNSTAVVAGDFIQGELVYTI